ncbi:hypothetical protein CRENBAI_017262 [Crenichthys baileyi]|uniref:Uncharacterized protein n=1 Tax=Crenichthys baileyi TaxID=28760 RepID=A0AAV9QZM1_9TELE
MMWTEVQQLSGDMTWTELQQCSGDPVWADLQQVPGVLAWAVQKQLPGVLAWAAQKQLPGVLAWKVDGTRQVLPQNTELERAKTAWVELQQAWETVLWQAKMRAYLLQPSRQLAGKPPPRQPNRKVLRADVSCGGMRVRASVPDQNAQPGEQPENGDEGDLSPEMESPTWIHHKPTAALTAQQNGAVSSPPPETGK